MSPVAEEVRKGGIGDDRGDEVHAARDCAAGVNVGFLGFAAYVLGENGGTHELQSSSSTPSMSPSPTCWAARTMVQPHRRRMRS